LTLVPTICAYPSEKNANVFNPIHSSKKINYAKTNEQTKVLWNQMVRSDVKLPGKNWQAQVGSIKLVVVKNTKLKRDTWI
jgi:hypothetical protein